MLLSALDKFGAGELERLLHLLEVLIVRYQLVGGGRAGRLEIACARLAQSIYEGRCASASQAAGIVKDVLPSDERFRDNFKTKQEKNTQKARYLLAPLETQVRRAGMGATAAELDPSRISLTLEHFSRRTRAKAGKASKPRTPTSPTITSTARATFVS